MGLHMMTTAEPLAELFRERVRLRPEAPAYRVFDHARGDWAELSWRAMDERVARRVQAGLARKGWFARLLFRTAVDVGWRAFEHRQGRARWHPALLFQPLDAAGRLFITGRLKDILVLASGEKVPPADMELALLGDPLFEQVMVIGEGRPHLALLAVLNPEESEPLLRAAGVDPTAPASLEDRRVEKAVLARANRALYAFPGFAKLRRALLFDRPWTVEEGLFTPTLKLKRPTILARHAQRIDALYARHD